MTIDKYFGFLQGIIGTLKASLFIWKQKSRADVSWETPHGCS